MPEHPVTALEILANSNFHLTIPGHPNNLRVAVMPRTTSSTDIAISPNENDNPLGWDISLAEESRYTVCNLSSSGVGRVRFSLNGTNYTFEIYQKPEDFPLPKQCVVTSFLLYTQRVREIIQSRGASVV